jgi:DnaJ family protein C protein 27
MTIKRLKILSLGNQYVGKSCLIKRYCEGKFVTDYISTIGIDYGVKPIEHKKQLGKPLYGDLIKFM